MTALRKAHNRLLVFFVFSFTCLKGLLTEQIARLGVQTASSSATSTSSESEEPEVAAITAPPVLGVSGSAAWGLAQPDGDGDDGWDDGDGGDGGDDGDAGDAGDGCPG